MLGSTRFRAHLRLNQVKGLLGGFRRGSDGKDSTCSAGDLGLIPGLGRFPGEGHGNPLQYSCLENPHEQRSLQATVHGIAKSQTGLNDQAHELFDLK